MKVTDEMAVEACEAYYKSFKLDGKLNPLAMRIAIQTIFDKFAIGYVDEIEPEEKQDGWILTYGRKPNLSDETVVQVLLRGSDKEDEYAQPVKNWYWLFTEGEFADDGDIIAYRIISEEKKEKYNELYSNPPVGIVKKDYVILEEEKPTKRKQTLLEWEGQRQANTKERIFSDRDDYTRWLFGELSEYLERSEG